MIGYEARIEYLEGRLEYQTEKADELKAENARLREALDKIAFFASVDIDTDKQGGMTQHIILTARAALAPPHVDPAG